MELKSTFCYWEELDKKRLGRGLKWFESRVFRRASKGVAIGSCLDVGGGTGFKFPVNNADYTLVEIDDAAISLFRERYPNGRFIRGNFLDIDCKQKYDLILIVQLPGDSECIRKVVLKAYSLLNDNGLMLFTVTNKNSYKALLYRSRDYAYQTSYYQWKEFLSSLKEVSVKYYGYGWLPFRRDSNCILIPILKWIDIILGKCVSISPWLLVAVRK